MRPPPLDREAALFLDFDGTLVEIAARPEAVRVEPQLPPLLERLGSERAGALAVVSGRPLAVLDRLLLPWRGAAAGLHGGERRRQDGTLADAADDRDAVAALASLRPALAALARRIPRVLLEDKGRTLAVHYRAAPERGEEILALTERLRRDSGNRLRLIAGKMVVELQPRSFGKGASIAAFMAEAPFRGRSPVFIGDDTTDEDGFAEVNRRGGMSVRVGDAVAATAAMRRLPSVAAALDWLKGGPGADGTTPRAARSEL